MLVDRGRDVLNDVTEDDVLRPISDFLRSSRFSVPRWTSPASLAAATVGGTIKFSAASIFAAFAGRPPPFGPCSAARFSIRLKMSGSISRTPSRQRLTGICSKCLLQIDGLVVASFVQLCAPHLMRTLVLVRTESQRRAQSQVEVMHSLEFVNQLFRV